MHFQRLILRLEIQVLGSSTDSDEGYTRRAKIAKRERIWQRRCSKKGQAHAGLSCASRKTNANCDHSSVSSLSGALALWNVKGKHGETKHRIAMAALESLNESTCQFGSIIPSFLADCVTPPTRARKSGAEGFLKGPRGRVLTNARSLVHFRHCSLRSTTLMSTKPAACKSATYLGV